MFVFLFMFVFSVQSDLEDAKQERRRQKLETLARLNTRKCRAYPVYGGDLVEAVTLPPQALGMVAGLDRYPRFWRQPSGLKDYVMTIEERLQSVKVSLYLLVATMWCLWSLDV